MAKSLGILPGSQSSDRLIYRYTSNVPTAFNSKDMLVNPSKLLEGLLF